MGPATNRKASTIWRIPNYLFSNIVLVKIKARIATLAQAYRVFRSCRKILLDIILELESDDYAWRIENEMKVTTDIIAGAGPNFIKIAPIIEEL